VVRVSGPAVLAVCKAVFPGFDMKPRTARLVNAAIDNLLAIYFPAPNSYTGEDVLELFPHGNPFIVRKLIEEICKVPGVRLAERGEFTERAFLNGKLDLTQAEAIGDILSANNSKALANAQRLLTGEISAEIKSLAEKVKEISALLELEVDFAEDNCQSQVPLLGGVPKAGWDILQSLENLKKRFRKSGWELPKAVLFGAPNAGKSTLVNALIEENRLIVSETPGTTRDFVEVPLHLPSGDILLIDTAGLANAAQNNIDEQAMQKTKEILEKANLKILVVNISVPLPTEYDEWKKNADLIVGTHADLEAVASGQWLATSGPKGFGIRELKESLSDMLFPKEESEEVWISSERQIACINRAEECVLGAKEALDRGQVELAAFEMREARKALCSITGEISDESVLNAIFDNFCIGK
jgi:tRNA modification GTPase